MEFSPLSPFLKRDGRLSCFVWFVESSPGVGQKYWCGWSHFGRTSFDFIMSFGVKELLEILLQKNRSVIMF